MDISDNNRPKTIIPTPPAVGERAPDFALTTPEGSTLTLSDLTADRTLIIFSRHLG